MKIIKSIIIAFCLSLSFFAININNTYAEGEGDGLTIKVTEKIPGANCKDKPNPDGTYNCTIKRGFDSVMDTFAKIIKYATLLASLGGVLFIVINGIAISASGVDSSAKEAAKGRITKTIIGLILLLLSGTLLNIIAPWVYK